MVIASDHGRRSLLIGGAAAVKFAVIAPGLMGTLSNTDFFVV